MKIAVLQAPQNFEILDEAIPEIQADEVLLRVAACGVCTSELDQWEGKAGGLTYPRFI
jgi:D-arabinose 1-dehydrogenase-like Zn-dependent alcohol dehydrogenase